MPLRKTARRLACLGLACLLAACGAGGGESASSQPQPEYVGGSTRREAVTSSEVQYIWPQSDAVFATIETSKGNIRAVLYPEYAPLAVENFCTLAEMGYYGDTEFHRVVRGFVIQGGDADGSGGHSIWGAPIQTERSDALYHFSGALCLAGADGKADTHLSQFYIVATPQGNLSEEALARLSAVGRRSAVVNTYRDAGGAPWLDYTDTVFGQVVEGMDVVDAIASVGTDEADRPSSPVTVNAVRLENWPPAQAAWAGG